MANQPDRKASRENEGYDEAARGGKDVPPTPIERIAPDEAPTGDEFDRASRNATNDVRRRERSAD